MNRTVCILTAGMGTRMGVYGTYINKALVPIDKKAAISHIIEKFPKNTEFVIALGHFAEQVKDYLGIAHASAKILFADVENYSGPGSGPGLSLLSCRHLLNKPFYFVSCDTLWDGDVNLDYDENWVGVAKIEEEFTARYCNFEIFDNRVISIADKVQVKGDHYKGFIGLCFIKDYETFWNGLSSPTLISSEHQISSGIQALVDKGTVGTYGVQWIDVGTLENYKKAASRHEDYDFSKTNEFLYIDNGLVIKFFADETIVEKRIAKTKLNLSVFPEINARKGQFYSYAFLEGQTLYERNNIDIFRKLLSWLDQTLWVSKKIASSEMSRICKSFYYDKTLQRLSMYHDKYEGSDIENIINGVRVPAVSQLIKQVPWESLYLGRASFIHGDLQFDNVIHTSQDGFVLLDWRQDFGGQIEYGDLYYDLSKLYGGIILNYDYIKKSLIDYSEDGAAISFDFAQRFCSDEYLNILTQFIVQKGWDNQKVRILVPLIYLNMSPLHHYPFDKMLYALGRLLLAEELNKCKKI